MSPCPRCGNHNPALITYRAGIYTCQAAATTPEELAALEEAGHYEPGGICATEWED